MVGASASDGLRASAKIPMTRTEGPAAAAEASVVTAKSTWPPITCPIRSPSPRKGTWLSGTLAVSASAAPARCVMVPTAVAAKVTGFPRATSTMSRTVLNGEFGPHDQRHLVFEGLADRREGGGGVTDVALHHRQHGMHQRRHEEERVAIRRRAGDIGDADSAARAGPVGHHEGLLEVRGEALGQRAQQEVNAAARGIGDGEIDCPLRVFRGLDGCRNHADRSQRGCGEAASRSHVHSSPTVSRSANRAATIPCCVGARDPDLAAGPRSERRIGDPTPSGAAGDPCARDAARSSRALRPASGPFRYRTR